MLLLNTSTFALEPALEPGPYAILSHTWEEEEVTFNDIKDLGAAKQKAGWAKIEQTCRLARDTWGLEYAWVDTCCIDKSSSAELSEAINSMFEWYRRATVCFAYLSDLESTEHDPTSNEAWQQLETNLPNCHWFTRGWTLQELIAPLHLDFYDCSWTRRGTKSAPMIKNLLMQITNIDEDTLSNPDNLSSVAVGRRMSWAAGRQTTRTEDIAYCLLGIFDVNLPMIYGEGSKAFLRLQEAVALATADLSLFAWAELSTSAQLVRGIFARDPLEFSDCHLLENINDPNLYDSRSFAIVNRSIEFRTYVGVQAGVDHYCMRLHCRHAGKRGIVSIRLLKTNSGFVRYKADEVYLDYDSGWDFKLDREAEHPNCGARSTDSVFKSWDYLPRSVSILKWLRPDDIDQVARRLHHAFHFHVSTPEGWSYKLEAVYSETEKNNPPPYWDESTATFLTGGHPRFTGLLLVSLHSRSGIPRLPSVWLFCGFRGNLTTPDHVDPLPPPWVAISGVDDDGWEGDSTFSSKGDGIFDMPWGLLNGRGETTPSRFLSLTGNVCRLYLSNGLTLQQQLRYSPSRDIGKDDLRLGRGMKVSVAVSSENVDGGTAHRVSVKFTEAGIPEVEQMKEPGEAPKVMPRRILCTPMPKDLRSTS